MVAAPRGLLLSTCAGFGLTAGHPADTAVLANRDLVVALALEHVVRRPAIVVGNLMGGMISTFVTRSRPDLVAGWCSSTPRCPQCRCARIRSSPADSRSSRSQAWPRPACDGSTDVASASARGAGGRVGLRRPQQGLRRPSWTSTSRWRPPRRDRWRDGRHRQEFTGQYRSLLRSSSVVRAGAAHLAALPVRSCCCTVTRTASSRSRRRGARRGRIPDWDYVEFAGVGHVPRAAAVVEMEVPRRGAVPSSTSGSSVASRQGTSLSRRRIPMGAGQRSPRSRGPGAARSGRMPSTRWSRCPTPSRREPSDRWGQLMTRRLTGLDARLPRARDADPRRAMSGASGILDPSTATEPLTLERLTAILASRLDAVRCSATAAVGAVGDRPARVGRRPPLRHRLPRPRTRSAGPRLG